MFGRLKNLFKKRPEEAPGVEEASESGYPPREFQQGYTPGAKSTPGVPPTATGARSPSETSPPPPAEAPPQPPPPATGDSIRISLKPLLLKLPEALKAKVRRPPVGNAYISIPLQKVLAQLPHGSVKISYGELRLASPAGVFLDISNQDQTSVELPLPEILSQLKPEQLPRRTTQKKMEVPDDVTGLFGPQGSSLSAVRVSSAPARTPSSASSTPPIAPRHVPASGPTITLKPAIPSAPSIRPSAPISPTSPLPPPPVKPASPLPAPSALRPQAAPAIKPSQPLPGPAVPRPPAPPSAAPAPAAPPPSAPMEPLVVPVSQLGGTWPDAIKQTLAELTNATVCLPANELEQALKRGKIMFPWKQIRLWIKPPPPPSASPALDDTQLELPLPVIAPLFIAHKKPVGPQKKYTLTENIPDVFTGKGLAPSTQAQVAGPITPSAPAEPAVPTVPKPATPAPIRPAIAPHVPAAPSVAAVQPQPEDIGEVFGQPGRKNWAPNEIVQRTSALKGVAGALIAMQDGLLVAGHLPPGLNPETVAAFVPQMFSRVMQYSKELKFGDANNLTVTVDDVPFKIFKTGGIFFTVLGRAGEPLPEPHLSIIAAQLGPQNK